MDMQVWVECRSPLLYHVSSPSFLYLQFAFLSTFLDLAELNRRFLSEVGQHIAGGLLC